MNQSVADSEFLQKLEKGVRASASDPDMDPAFEVISQKTLEQMSTEGACRHWAAETSLGPSRYAICFHQESTHIHCL